MKFVSPEFIVVSGPPASGKLTLGHRLATAFSPPIIDKDDILEALIDALGGRRHLNGAPFSSSRMTFTHSYARID